MTIKTTSQLRLGMFRHHRQVFPVCSDNGLALHWLAPVSFPRGRLTPVWLIAGAALNGAGIVLVVLARRELALHGQPTDPGLPTAKLVNTGVFSLSRNPPLPGRRVYTSR